ncbi:MAG: primosomal protein N' [Thermodesulfovibrionales bacterium]|nr:primosomal protein N' [Thermodesulfovibrionales bacterium]
MIESEMDFYDVVFPVNIGALTYRCPEALSGHVKPGMMVSVYLKNSITKGIVLRKASGICSGKIKDIREVHDTVPVLSSSLIHLLEWMSDYYIAEQGLVLKNILPKEVFAKVSLKKTRQSSRPRVQNNRTTVDRLNTVPVDNTMVNAVTASISDSTYKTFLLHAPSSAYAYSFLLKTIAEARNGIILVPEISALTILYSHLSEHFGERICLFHGELSKGKRREAIARILSSQSDIMLGTRSAVFAPFKKISFIVVLQEHSSSYKQENSPCYSGRDIAVMRGFFEKATVLLTSVSPSIESLYNGKSGKYIVLKPESDVKVPKVRVIDMRYEKHIKPYLSKTVIDTATKHLKRAGKIMFVVNRRGYSTLLECMDCNYVEECPDCKIPLVYHKQDMSMKCHYCGYTQSKVPEFCSRCKGHNLQLLGAGTQRAQEDIENILGISTIRLDSDKMKRKSLIAGVTGAACLAENRIIIGTKLMTRRLDSTVQFSMAAILNTDIFLNLPDFRSAEKAYQEISSVIDKIEPNGEILIQTRLPHHYLFKGVKNNDYDLFFQEELHRRKALLYPPFSRLILIKCVSKRELSKEISENIKKTGGDVEILGPSVSKNKKKEYEYKLLLKSPVRGKLHAAAKSIIETFRASKDVRVKIDVDPYVI